VSAKKCLRAYALLESHSDDGSRLQNHQCAEKRRHDRKLYQSSQPERMRRKSGSGPGRCAAFGLIRQCAAEQIGLFQFRAEHEGPIRAAAGILGHGDADRRYLGTQQVLAVSRASHPALHRIAERFLPGRGVF
jgi:hypothetical protein